MQKCLIEWNSLFLTISFIKEGTSKKVLQFLMPLEPNYHKSSSFYKQKKFIMNNAVSFKQYEILKIRLFLF